MRLATKMSMLSLLVLSLSSCQTVSVDDSFCLVYNKVIVAKGDGAITASQGVKRRLLANELTYNDQCQKEKS